MGETGKSVQKAVRRRRLSAELRENLKRRKAQARGRTAGSANAQPCAEPHDSAGIDTDKASALPAARPADEREG
jgi:hypothetical protein